MTVAAISASMAQRLSRSATGHFGYCGTCRNAASPPSVGTKRIGGLCIRSSDMRRICSPGRPLRTVKRWPRASPGVHTKARIGGAEHEAAVGPRLEVPYIILNCSEPGRVDVHEGG